MAELTSAAERVYAAYNYAENAHDLDATASLVAPDLQVTINGRASIASAEEDRVANALLFATYPDYRREILEVIADGDRAAIRWRMVGSPVPDSGLTSLDLYGCSIVAVRDGLIAGAHLYVDESALAAVLPRSGG